MGVKAKKSGGLYRDGVRIPKAERKLIKKEKKAAKEVKKKQMRMERRKLKAEKEKEAKAQGIPVKTAPSTREVKIARMLRRAAQLEKKVPKMLAELENIKAQVAQMNGDIQQANGEGAVSVAEDYIEIKSSIEEPDVVAQTTTSPVCKDDTTLTTSQAIEAQLRETSRAATETAANPASEPEASVPDAEKAPASNGVASGADAAVTDPKLSKEERKALKKQRKHARNAAENGTAPAASESDVVMSSSQHAAELAAAPKSDSGSQEPNPIFLLSEHLTKEIERRKANAQDAEAAASTETQNSSPGWVVDVQGSKEDDDNKRKWDSEFHESNDFDAGIEGSRKKSKKEGKDRTTKRDKKKEQKAAKLARASGESESAGANPRKRVKNKDKYNKKKIAAKAAAEAAAAAGGTSGP